MSQVVDRITFDKTQLYFEIGCFSNDDNSQTKKDSSGEKSNMKNPIFVINAELDEGTKVSGSNEQVNFIRFHGTSDSEYFHGGILTGGVDCQRK